MKTIFTLLIISLLCACKTYNDQDKKNFDEQIQSYISKEKLNLETSPSGLYFKIIQKGSGDEIHFSDSVTCTYTGKLLNGKIFDNQKNGIKFAFKDLIPAWKEILIGEKEGFEAFLVCPPQLGYGDHKLDKIPENSILTFTLKLEKVN
jgi:FKBP-type peptidyl-prolyl cis-trans isomerase FkpA